MFLSSISGLHCPCQRLKNISKTYDVGGRAKGVRLVVVVCGFACAFEVDVDCVWCECVWKVAGWERKGSYKGTKTKALQGVQLTGSSKSSATGVDP